MTPFTRTPSGVIRTALVVAVLMAACARNQDGARIAGTTDDTPVTPTTAGPTSPGPPIPTGTGESAISPLKRHDAVPAGIQAQIKFFALSELFCHLRVAPGTSPPSPGPRFEVAHRYDVCLSGFDPEQDIVHISVLEPDGTESRSEDISASEGKARWLFTPLPEDPKDDYTLVATQPPPEGQTEPLVASGGFTVVIADADDPVMATVTGSGPPGTTFRIALAGFGAGSVVPLYLYDDPELPEATFRATLPPATVDADGETTYELPTAPDDPAGTYGIAAEAGAQSQGCDVTLRCVTFTVTG